MKKYLTLCAIFSLFLSVNFISAKVPPSTWEDDFVSANNNVYPPVTNEATIREMNKSKLNEFRKKDDFTYSHKVTEQAPKKEKQNTAMPKFDFPTMDTQAFWDKVLILLAILCTGLILWGVFGRQLSRIFFKTPSPLSADEDKMEQDIKLADFDTLISNAVKDGEYRKAVRMLYLEALKVLSINQWILWKPNKTNQDYLNELQLSPFKKAFSDLTLQFEYIWYGDFPVNEEVFQQTQNTFQDFKNNVRSKAK